MGRTPIIAGNWKMFKTQSETAGTIRSLLEEVEGHEKAEVVICPPFTSLAEAGRLLTSSSVRLGAQDVHWEEEGAYTGEISVRMLLDCGCDYVIIGHSERRQYFAESDESVNRKLTKAMEASLSPIVCVGETLEEREGGRVSEVVLGQLSWAVAGLTENDASLLIIAYEPVWAIGTGKTATPEVAEEVHAMIRKWLAQTFSEDISSKVRVLYGGSVKPSNIEELMAQPDIDGALVGGASLEARTFARIVRY
jgi:triosephosphate isomerase